MPDEHAALIVAALEQSRWPRSVGDLAVTTGLRRKAVARALEKLADEGAVQRIRRGLYLAHR